LPVLLLIFIGLLDDSIWFLKLLLILSALIATLLQVLVGVFALRFPNQVLFDGRFFDLPDFVTHLFWRLANPVRFVFGLPIVRMIPNGVLEVETVRHAADLLPYALSTVKRLKKTDSSRKREIQIRLELVIETMVYGLWKLADLRQIKQKIARGLEEQREQIAVIESGLSSKMTEQLEVFTNVLVSLQRIDVVTKQETDKILNNLKDISDGMNDLVESYNNIQNIHRSFRETSSKE
jgi:hypothetical protein